jgi:hypothetical protein
LGQDPLGLAAGEHLSALAPNVQGWVDPLGLACEPTATNAPKSAETPHTVSGSRPPHGGRTGTPNSIWEQRRADGGRSVTYFDEQGRRFSREDYGQNAPHGTLGQDVSGRTVPHEHRYNYSNRGPTGKQYRELDEDGKPIGPWEDD